MPLAFGEWELERGFELDRAGLDELDAAEKASRPAATSCLDPAVSKGRRASGKLYWADLGSLAL